MQQTHGILTLVSHLAGNMYEVPKQWLMPVSAFGQLSQAIPTTYQYALSISKI